MAAERGPKGPIGNSPRDLLDDAVGEPAEKIKAGEPPRWPRKPKRVTGDTFHSKVSGESATKRADRAPHFRKGGWVGGGGMKSGGKVKGGKHRDEGGTVGFFGGKSYGSQWKEENRKAQEDTFARNEAARREQDARSRASGEGVAQTQQKKAGGVLSAKTRQSLPKSDFALPGKGKGPKGAGSGSYPIPDESHARNALARASGKPVEAAVRAKVHAKYPDIGKKKAGGSVKRAMGGPSDDEGVEGARVAKGGTGTLRTGLPEGPGPIERKGVSVYKREINRGIRTKRFGKELFGGEEPAEPE